MTGVAAEALKDKLRLNYTLIDQDRAFVELMQRNLIKGYASLCDDNEIPTADSFQGMIPGTPEWVKMWTDRPELHEQMITYAESRRAAS